MCAYFWDITLQIAAESLIRLVGSLPLLFALVTEHSTLCVLHEEENLIASKHQRELNLTCIRSRAMQSNTLK